MQNKTNPIGTVLFVQVQREPLKAGSGPDRVYDPGSLERVQELILSARGVVGVCEDGERVLDAHHADHPRSRNRAGMNGISIGFTGHYVRMREQYGPHLVDGIAGENMIVSSETPLGPEDLAGELVFENPDGSQVRFQMVKAMAPCNEFSHFAHQAREKLAAEVLKDTLKFLDGGTRGYAMLLADVEEARILPGAQVYRAA